jgi:hypothetical protein
MEQLALYARALIATVAPCESVRPVLAGPFPVLPEDADPAEEARAAVVAAAAAAVRPMLEQLLEAGAPLPAVGADVGEPVITSSSSPGRARRSASRSTARRTTRRPCAERVGTS